MKLDKARLEKYEKRDLGVVSHSGHSRVSKVRGVLLER